MLYSVAITSGYGSSVRARARNLGLTVDRVQHPEIVGLAFLQRAVDKDMLHVNSRTDDTDHELWRKRHFITFTFSHLADAYIQSDLQLGNT